MKQESYKSSGVDIDRANSFVRSIQSGVLSTFSRDVLKSNGAFGSLFAVDMKAYKHPVLVSSADGVGTKLLVANAAGKHDTVGIDLVAMNVNDILCTGAKPLFFLDYIACGRLDSSLLKEVVKGMVKGCRDAGCSLIGGETAEMPGMYYSKDFDLAGFAVGIVDRDKIIDGSKIRKGDQAIGLASNGLHSNGFSLVRRVFSFDEQKQFATELLRPTKIYVKDVLPLTEKFNIHGIAHITGGAFYEKLTKVLPKGKCFVIDRNRWTVPNIFQKIQKKGKIDDTEMFRTFNMGIGMVIVVPKKDAPAVTAELSRKRIRAQVIGEVIHDPKRRVIL